MMQSNLLFWLLICGHLLGDFYFQSEDLVNKKKNRASYLGLHGLIYLLALLFLLTPIMNQKVFAALLLIAASHLAIDFIKIQINKTTSSNPLLAVVRKNSFFLDQLIHLGIITSIAFYYAIADYIALNMLGNALFEACFDLEVVIHPVVLLRIFFVILVIGKPANILIKEINKKENIKKSYQGESHSKSESEFEFESERNPDPTISEYQNAGKIIGILERLIIVVMLILEQYAAIGLVLTAKSITRYDKISKEPSFAEYYLVGTLLSFLIAIAAVLLIQPV